MGKASKGPKRRGGKFFPALVKCVGALILALLIVSSLCLVVPRAFGYEAYTVVSGSMAPEIPTGSVVYVRPVEPESVRAGDVIAFQAGRSAVVHRVVENQSEESSFITKGDANDTIDLSAVPYSQLLGEVALHLPWIGSVLLLYADVSRKGILIGLALIGMLLLILGDQLKGPKPQKNG